MRSRTQNATVPEEGKIHLTYSLFANLIEYIFSQKVEKIKETIGTANPGNSKEAVPEGGEIHRTYTLFAISGGVFAVQVPTRPPPKSAAHLAARPATQAATHPVAYSRTVSHTRLLHILVCFTSSYVSHIRSLHSHARLVEKLVLSHFVA